MRGFRQMSIGAFSILVISAVLRMHAEAQVSNPFPDTSLSTLEGQAAAELFSRGVISGFPDGEFKGALPVNRAQAAKILLNAAGKAVFELPNNGRFFDVYEGQWYTAFVMSAAEHGIIAGYPDGSFRPDRGINTAEFLKMITLAFGTEQNLPYNYKDVPLNEWFARYAGLAEKHRLFPLRTSYLAPAAQLSRADVVIAIYQLLGAGESDTTSTSAPPPVAVAPSPPVVTGPSPAPAPAQPPPPAPVADPPVDPSAPVVPPPPPSFPPPPPPPAVPQALIIDVDIDNWSFSPASITVKQGQQITLRLKGKNGVHGFSAPQLGINQSVGPGQSIDVSLPTDASGTYNFFCNIPCGTGHGDMFGQIVINP